MAGCVLLIVYSNVINVYFVSSLSLLYHTYNSLSPSATPSNYPFAIAVLRPASRRPPRGSAIYQIVYPAAQGACEQNQLASQRG